MADLRTDYKDDILDLTQNTQRKYRMITNDDGTVSFEDVTVYSQIGDSFGATDVNTITDALNNTEGSVRYNSETDMIQIVDADGVWHDWAGGGLLPKIVSLLTADAVWDKSHTDTSYATSNTVTTADGSVEFALTVSAGNGVEYSYTLPDEIYAVNTTELDFGGTTSGSPASTKYYLQLSTNKTDWVTVATISGNSGFEHSVDISGYERFYVRFVTKMNNTGSALVKINTLQYS